LDAENLSGKSDMSKPDKSLGHPINPGHFGASKVVSGKGALEIPKPRNEQVAGIGLEKSLSAISQDIRQEISHCKVAPGQNFRLKDCVTRSKVGERLRDLERSALGARLGEQLNQLQMLLYSGKQRGLLLVLQGMDTSGKDGAIRRVFSHVSPLGVRAHAFGAPTPLELEHDFLWRVHAVTPALGEIVVFNRSHYEDVLVPIVKGNLGSEVIKRRYAHIRAFESLLNDQGIKIVKCFLNISKEEQKKRLKDRLEDPNKQWKLQPSDFEDRALWNDFQHAYEQAIEQTSTSEAPWYVLPADSKHYRDILLTQLLTHSLEQMGLPTPQPKYDLSGFDLD
jgi:PPK2 family polyphosphate:nucleotide phosphotransferase